MGVKIFQIGAKEISNRGRDYKSGQGLQIGAEYSYCLRTIKAGLSPLHKNSMHDYFKNI